MLLSGQFQNCVGWCLTSGGAGHEAQCLGVFDELNINPVIKRVNPQGWYRTLAPIGPADPHSEIIPPWPDILIVSGRQALPYARYIRRRSRGKSFVVVLQRPGLPSSWFDFIWVPQHDKLSGSNVLSTLTSPNRITNERIKSEVSRYQHVISNLPKPLVTVLIGGPSRSFEFGLQEAEQFADDLIKLHQKTGCSFLITPSYRTGTPLIDFFNQRLAHIPVRIGDVDGGNPYLGYLGLADFVIVTADSVNMLGEAASTGRPVYAYPIPHRHNKFLYFYQSMIDCGAMRWYNGDLESWTYEPVNATSLIAHEIGSRFLSHYNKITT